LCDLEGSYIEFLVFDPVMEAYIFMMCYSIRC
jgi:hypothetical protein